MSHMQTHLASVAADHGFTVEATDYHGGLTYAAMLKKTSTGLAWKIEVHRESYGTQWLAVMLCKALSIQVTGDRMPSFEAAVSRVFILI